PGRPVYCWQQTIQYPGAMRRKMRKRGGQITARKLRATCSRLGAGSSPGLRGSRKKKRMRKNIAKTLRAEMQKTLSRPKGVGAQSATKGPAVPPIFTMV